MKEKLLRGILKFEIRRLKKKKNMLEKELESTKDQLEELLKA